VITGRRLRRTSLGLRLRVGKRKWDHARKRSDDRLFKDPAGNILRSSKRRCEEKRPNVFTFGRC
jgi:hypothetical protein